MAMPERFWMWIENDLRRAIRVFFKNPSKQRLDLCLVTLHPMKTQEERGHS